MVARGQGSWDANVEPNEISDKLRDMIYTGRLYAGQPVVEADLVRQMGVGRVPLRDALARLQSEGLVYSAPDGGLHVADFGPAELLEVCSMRVLLEPAAARYAATRGGPQLYARLRELCTEMARINRDEDSPMLDVPDYRFHLEIVKASGHSRLVRAYEASHVRILTERMRYAAAPSSSSSDDLVDCHERIVECLERRQPDDAAEVAFKHVAATLKATEQDLGFRLEDMGTTAE